MDRLLVLPYYYIQCFLGRVAFLLRRSKRK